MIHIVKNYIKIAAIHILWIILRLFWVFTIKKNRIMFIAYGGRQYGCNPKYIFEYLYDNYNDTFEYIWCLNDKTKLPKKYKHIKTVKWNSFSFFYFYFTTKICISNMERYNLPLRRIQIFINTWHGGGVYKSNGISNMEIYANHFRNRKKTNNTYIISSSEVFTNNMMPYFNEKKERFLPFGMPRNDMFFNHNESIINKVKENLNIPLKSDIVLYAPTFRGAFNKATFKKIYIDISMLLNALSSIYKKEFFFLFRSHYAIEEKESLEENILDVTSYPDVQELLYTADVLISDYSSVMWDFSLTYKPCFVFAPDLKDYKLERDFSSPPEEWPFPIAQTNEDLRNNILSFDNSKYIERVKLHHETLGSFEKGNATETISNFLYAYLYS
jgi:CDP-glycerol glycerophosphotransferase